VPSRVPAKKVNNTFAEPRPTKQTNEPTRSSLRPKKTTVVKLDPVLDFSLLGATATLGIVLEAVISTGELEPQEPGDPDKLLAIDRWRTRSDDYKDGSPWGDIALYTTIGFALVDVVLASVLERGDPWYHYAMMYAQSTAIADHRGRCASAASSERG
jgi:hypothetical protein